MDHKEAVAASNALIGWFKSQGIEPADASLIMLGVIAAQLVKNSKDANRLAAAVNNAATILTFEIANELRNK